MEFRKLIRFGKSSFVISLPKPWLAKNNLEKGSLVRLNEDNDELILSAKVDDEVIEDVANLDVSNLSVMVPRLIHAMYKKGVDKLVVTFDDSKMMDVVQASIGKETLGYEIIDQTKNKCVIKNISGGLEGFNHILRRTFLLLISMANDAYDAFSSKEYDRLKNVAFLEEANNRFTTSCRRILNKQGSDDYKYVGPIYYIIEDLENLADEYKYLCLYFADKNPKLNKDNLDIFNDVNALLKSFYELFYKFDNKKVTQIASTRKEIIKRILAKMKETKNSDDFMLLHYLLIITQKVFNYVGPLLVLKS